MLTTKFIDIPPLSGVAGTVRVPGSKSISNRALLLAGFAAGTTVIEGVLDSDDTRVMIDALVQLGCGIEAAPHRLTVHGVGGRPTLKSATFFLGNAGTAMRPLTATLALFAASSDASFELRGTPRMHERPIGDLVDTLRALGCGVECLEKEGYPPLRVSAGKGPLSFAAPLKVRGDVSSQFLSALLLALPLRAEPVDAVIEVEGELISKPYVEITLKLLEAFGIAVEREGTQRYRLVAGQPLRSPGRFVVEGDASSASYFIAAAAIGAVDSPLRIEGIDSGSIQGDIAFADAVRAMGASIESGSGWLEVRRGRWPLAAIDLDCNPLPDAAMTLAALALFADGPSTPAQHRQLAGQGDRSARGDGERAAQGRRRGRGRPGLPGDHAAAHLAGREHRHLRRPPHGDVHVAGGVQPARRRQVPVRILDPRCVAKTWPDYFEALFSVARARREAVPVLTIDGPTASGKGTLASEVAAALGYRLLDSGAVYRAVAVAALDAGIAAENEAALAALAASLDLRFDGDRCHLGGRDVTDSLRREEVGAMASRISAWPAVRAAVLEVQLAFRDVPGLVADGRDMGSVVFPDAELKVFLTAGPAERADRRYKQLISKGIPAKLDSLRAELEARDARDKNRSASPLVPAEGAFMLDNSALSIEASVDARP